MSAHFKAVDRETIYLFPPSVQDWLPERHLARFVVDVVSKLDLRELKMPYTGVAQSDRERRAEILEKHLQTPTEVAFQLREYVMGRVAKLDRPKDADQWTTEEKQHRPVEITKKSL
jgi:hypothetical protein